MSKLYNIFKLAKSKIKPRTKPDKSKVDLARSQLNISKAKEKSVTIAVVAPPKLMTASLE